MPTFRVLASPVTDPQLTERWEALVTGCPDATPFQTPAWSRVWWETHRSGKQPMTLILEDGDDLVGIFPLHVRPGPWRALRAVGTGASDYLFPLVRPEYAEVFRGHLLEFLARGRGFDLVDLHQIPETHALAAEAGPEQARCLVLRLPETFDAYVKTLSKSLRYEARRLEKPPYSTGEASLQTASTPEEAVEALRIFIGLHERRWRKRGLPGAFAFPRVRRMHERFVARAVLEDRLRLTVLRHKGRPIGALYAMRVGATTFFYQSGFEPEAKALSPGTVLVAHAIRRAIEEGGEIFDFLRGDEPYKRRWGPQTERRNLRLLKSVRPIFGTAGHLWNRAGGIVEGKVRARLEGRGLVS